jgi:hypothetical protein
MHGAIHPLPQYVFISWCLVQNRENLHLPFIIIIIIIITGNIFYFHTYTYNYFKFVIYNLKFRTLAIFEILDF